MKVIFFGLGSIGQRHLHNFKAICEELDISPEIHALRTSDRVVDFTEVKSIYEEYDVDSDYDIAFVTNPTSMHFKTLEFINSKARFFFVEKPLFEQSYIQALNWDNPENYYVACPLRYKSVLQKTKQLLEDHKVLNARAICSSFLPAWRDDDYRKSYSARPELGGGVELDCIHELDYVVDLFGWPQETRYMFGKVSSLEIDSNDTALYILKYSDKFVEVHLDYFGTQIQRKIEIITDTDLITIDLLANTIEFAKEDKTIEITEEYNQFYLSEMKYFLANVVKNKENHNDLIHAYKILQLALGKN